ncbi:DUF2867 domain-containing protein [Janthinobacterium aquaticum]|uniref:DUF2867 domain-containing protein n=1 Tax=Janthinobacterium sp. FT58W TaxID=2654254 RepID=UPI001D01B0A1|nr:DUF2867 domain-containing protein [Janthinobacterium sp. FT58W]
MMGSSKVKVRKVELPRQASIAGLYPGSHLADAYQIALGPRAHGMDMESLARVLLGSQPRWAQALMVLRDAIVAPFGIKTASELAGGEGGRIGIFRIYSVTDDEIVVGEDDSHLDFRLSMLRSADGSVYGSVTLASAVHCHNRIGRAYIFLIRPFHELIVRRSLTRAARLHLA